MNSTSSTISVKPPLILCIDDADIALRVRKLLLGSEGYNVLTADSGEEGLELFRQNPVELVIADHFLSGKSGIEIAREDEGTETRSSAFSSSPLPWTNQPALNSWMGSGERPNHRTYCSMPSLAF